MPQPIHFLVAYQATTPEGRSTEIFVSCTTFNAVLAYLQQYAEQPWHAAQILPKPAPASSAKRMLAVGRSTPARRQV
jgi:hypothetical protein